MNPATIPVANFVSSENDLDWIDYWNKLVKARSWKYDPKAETDFDYWRTHARDFSKRVTARWNQPDSTRNFLIQLLQKAPDSTLLDIGAGTGNWAIRLARYVRHVTAIEPSAGMRMVFREVQLEQQPAPENITLINGKWPEIETEPHDFTLCSHAMYGFPDLKEAITKINRLTRVTCFLLIRAPMPNDPIALLAKQILGRADDSPNFRVLYNACLQMGIYPNVLFEEFSQPHPRRYESPEAAMEDLRIRFQLAPSAAENDLIRSTIDENLIQSEKGDWMLKMNVKVALVYWDPARNPGC